MDPNWGGGGGGLGVSELGGGAGVSDFFIL